MKRGAILMAVIVAAAGFMVGCTSMSKDTRVIATQGVRLVPVDYEVIGDTAAQDTRTYILGIDFAHLFNDELAANIDENTDKGLMYKLLAPKEDKAKCGNIINNCLQICYWAAVAVSPILPFTTEKILKILNIKDSSLNWDSICTPCISGGELGENEILFPQLEMPAPEEKPVELLIFVIPPVVLQLLG